MSKHVKVLFEILKEDSDEIELESCWAKPIGEGYQIDNIPFYAIGYAFNDIVSASERDGMLYVEGLLEASGHGTLRIWFYDPDIIQSTRLKLEQMGCSSEVSDLPKLVSIDVPKDIDYQEIREFLEDGARREVFDYQEACVPDHWYGE